VFLGKTGAVLAIVSTLAATVFTAGRTHGQVAGATFRGTVEDSSSTILQMTKPPSETWPPGLPIVFDGQRGALNGFPVPFPLEYVPRT
jgi:hypothetical protein